MKSIPRVLAGLASALPAFVVSGCALLNAAQPKDEPQDGPAATSLAGTWTRQGESPRVFDVTDDGATVHGELRDKAGFKEYAFDLKRSGGKLTGTARIQPDYLEKAMECRWEAKVEGSVVKVKQEEHVLKDDSDEVEKTELVDYAYDVQAASAAPAPMPAMDMSEYVAVLPTYQHLLMNDDVAVGQWVDLEMESAAGKSVTRTAIVHDAGDAWVVEVDNQMLQKDLLLAVFVDKETGRPTKAYVGNRGKAGKEKAVPPPQDTTTGPGGEAIEEEVTVPAGTFAALRTDVEVQGGTASTWIGAPGSDAEGVMLKSESAAGTDELRVLELVNVDVSGATFEARRTVYTSGNDLTTAIGETKPYLNHVMLRTSASGATMTVVAVGTDARPQLDYPR